MPDKELVAELAAHRFMKGLPAELIEHMAECVMGVSDWEADAVLFQAGGIADRCFLIRSGEVALEVHSPGRGSRIVQTVSRGEVLGWSWLFPPYRWEFDARVLTPVEALVLDGEKMRACVEENREFGFEVMSRFAEVIVGRLHATRLQLLDLYASRS
jgi:CRP-like cAMP-binding protein